MRKAGLLFLFSVCFTLFISSCAGMQRAESNNSINKIPNNSISPSVSTEGQLASFSPKIVESQKSEDTNSEKKINVNQSSTTTKGITISAGASYGTNIKTNSTIQFSFLVKNLSDTDALHGFIIKMENPQDCEVDANDMLHVTSNKNFEWVYSGVVNSKTTVSLSFGVIPEQAGNHNVIFTFFMSDGKTPCTDTTGNSASVSCSFNVLDTGSSGYGGYSINANNAVEVSIDCPELKSVIDKHGYISLNLKIENIGQNEIQGIIMKVTADTGVQLLDNELPGEYTQENGSIIFTNKDIIVDPQEKIGFTIYPMSDVPGTHKIQISLLTLDGITPLTDKNGEGIEQTVEFTVSK